MSLDTVAVGQFGAMIAGHLDRGGMAVIATHIDLGLGARAETLDLSQFKACLLYTSPSPRDLSTSRMPSSA